jgi:2-oxoglutarate ferredoxin oxidoreductase subunit beta
VTKSIQEALNKKGFSFIEVITPCPTLYARRNRLGSGLDLMKYYYDSSEIRNGADTRETEIDFQGKITCGKFVDKENPTFLDAMNSHFTKTFGDEYEPYGVEND